MHGVYETDEPEPAEPPRQVRHLAHAAALLGAGIVWWAARQWIGLEVWPVVGWAAVAWAWAAIRAGAAPR